MKKLIATVVTLIVLSMGALPLTAQTRGRRVNRSTNNGRTETRFRDDRYRNDIYRTNVSSDEAYNNNVYPDDNNYGQNFSVWDEHRDKITTAGGALGGALLGGLIGGKKGALIGAITGGAGAAVYTYKIRNKDTTY
jgi:hypothetical protein